MLVLNETIEPWTKGKDMNIRNSFAVVGAIHHDYCDNEQRIKEPPKSGSFTLLVFTTCALKFNHCELYHGNHQYKHYCRT